MTYTPGFRTAIVAHVDRQHAAWRLFERTNASRMEMDHGGVGAGRNHLKAWDWLAKNNEREWSVVLEDDALVLPDYEEQVRMALAVAPASIVSFYLGRARPPHWQDSIAMALADPCDHHWLLSDHLLHHVAVAVRTEIVRAMHTDVSMFAEASVPIDEAIGGWARFREMPIAYSNPSLVDHRWEQQPLIKHRVESFPRDLDHRRNPRKAWVIGGREAWDDTHRMLPPPREVVKGRYVPDF
jgi:GR25 family glycosyltransferase involved in LPS biosynthesis